MSDKYYFRFIEAEQSRAAADDRTVTVTFSSEEPVQRRDCLEVLSHCAGDYDLHRLTDGGAVLNNHDGAQQIGVVDKAWVEEKDGRRVGRAIIRFSRNQLADEIYQDVQDGIRTKISFGYQQIKLLSSESGPNGLPINRYSWLALEVSIVPTPADTTVGVDRTAKTEMTRNFMQTSSAFDRLAVSLLGKRNEAPSVAETILDLIGVKRSSKVEAESDRLSAAGMGQLPDSHMGHSGSAFISFETLRRDLQVGVYGQGGAFVGEEKLPIAFPLMNRTIAERCGARIITGLSGTCFLPRFTSLPTAANLSEMATAADSTPTTDQIRTTPHRVTVTCNLTRQLDLQNPGITQSLTQLIVAALAVKVDGNFLYGQDVDEPLGILNLPGIGTATFGGPATFDIVTALEEALTNNNVECDPATTWYFTSPKSKTKLKKAAKSAGITQPIWGTEAGVDYVNGYRALASNQVRNNQLAFVDFSHTALCVYSDGVELIYNPFTFDTSGKVKITAHIWIDVLADHVQAIAASTDGANQ